jgi:hypothetical protein
MHVMVVVASSELGICYVQKKSIRNLIVLLSSVHHFISLVLKFAGWLARDYGAGADQ